MNKKNRQSYFHGVWGWTCPKCGEWYALENGPLPVGFSVICYVCMFVYDHKKRDE